MVVVVVVLVVVVWKLLLKVPGACAECCRDLLVGFWGLLWGAGVWGLLGAAGGCCGAASCCGAVGCLPGDCCGVGGCLGVGLLGSTFPSPTLASVKNLIA